MSILQIKDYKEDYLKRF